MVVGCLKTHKLQKGKNYVFQEKLAHKFHQTKKVHADQICCCLLDVSSVQLKNPITKMKERCILNMQQPINPTKQKFHRNITGILGKEAKKTEERICMEIISALRGDQSREKEKTTGRSKMKISSAWGQAKQRKGGKQPTD